MKNLFKLLLLILGSGCATQSHIFQSFQFRDDVCSTVYFYLDRTSTSLPNMQSEDVRLHNLRSVEGANTI